MTANELGAVHFIGIGGAGMSGIARILVARGIPVSAAMPRTRGPSQGFEQSVLAFTSAMTHRR